MTGSSHNQKAIGAGFALIAIFVAALNLRAGISAVGPVLADILDWYDAPSAMGGLITAMPGTFFALMGLAAVPMASRLGLSRTLLLGMALILVGTAVRPWVGTIWLFLLFTAFVVAGIAIGNVLLPAWIKLHGGKHVVTLMTVNTTVLGLSGTIAPLSAVLADRPGGWRYALFVWVSLAIAQILVWIVVAARTGYDFPKYQQASGSAQLPGMWRSRSAVALMIYFGLQSMNAYIQFGYFPQMLIDGGVNRSTAAVALSVLAGCGIVGGLLIPTVIYRARRLEGLPVALAALTIIGYAGVIYAPTAAPMLWSVIVGVGAWAFPVAVNLIVEKSRHPLVAARLSGFVQPLGYIIAAVGPLAVGFAHGADAGWAAILWVLIGFTVLQAVIGFVAARPSVVDDELGLT